MTLAYALMIVAAVGLLARGWRRLRPVPRLKISERGLRARDLGWGWILWDEIEGAYPPGVDQGETLRLRVRVTPRLAAAMRRRGHPPPREDTVEIRLDLAGTGLSAVELLQRILARCGDTPKNVARAQRIRDA